MAKLTKEKVTSCLKGSALTLATLAGVIGGVIFGLALRQREGKDSFLELGPVSNESPGNFTYYRGIQISHSSAHF